MLQRLSLREECPRINDEQLLNDILERLCGEFLILSLDDLQIEVHEQDVEPIRRQLAILSEQVMQAGN